MLSLEQAKTLANEAFPEGKIQKAITYKDLYIFQIFFSDDSYEGIMDPFFSVNSNTGEFKDFSILTDGDFIILSDLFEKAKNYE